MGAHEGGNRRKNHAFAAARKRVGLTQEALAHLMGVDRTTVHAWESGEHEPLPFFRPKLAKVLKTSLDGVAAILADRAAVAEDGAAPLPGGPRGWVASQDEWLRVRQAPGVRGRELTELAAWLYPEADRAPGGHVLAGPGWLMDEPVDLDAVELRWMGGFPAYTFPQSVPVDDLLPLNDRGVRYSDYSRAVRDLVRPRLLENRMSYRLVAFDGGAAPGLGFSGTTFFEVFDLKQRVAHEFKRAWLLSGRSIPQLDDLPLRVAIGDPFDPAKLLMSPGINTLTIRRGRTPSETGFVLHERDGGKVADGGGLCHTMPSGEFQPSSADPVDVANDFSLWRNVMREFSEEFLGNPEHDGCGHRAIDYERDEPFARFEDARRRGTFRMWWYGLVVEPLELGVQQLTAAVVDAPEFDSLFAGMVAVNDEGRVVGRGDAKCLPFTEEAIDRLEPRLSASALTLLRTAWGDRHLLLGD